MIVFQQLESTLSQHHQCSEIIQHDLKQDYFNFNEDPRSPGNVNVGLKRLILGVIEKNCSQQNC